MQATADAAALRGELEARDAQLAKQHGEAAALKDAVARLRDKERKQASSMRAMAALRATLGDTRTENDRLRRETQDLAAKLSSANDAVNEIDADAQELHARLMREVASRKTAESALLESSRSSEDLDGALRKIEELTHAP